MAKCGGCGEVIHAICPACYGWIHIKDKWYCEACSDEATKKDNEKEENKL